jgi:hypothetical protein
VRKLELLDAAERPLYVCLIGEGDSLSLDLSMLGIDLAQVSKLRLLCAAPEDDLGSWRWEG